MKKFGYYILGSLLRGFFYLTAHVPSSLIYAVAKQSSALFIRFSRRYQRKITRNLKIAFGSPVTAYKLLQLPARWHRTWV